MGVRTMSSFMGDVLIWKHNAQEGMETRDDVITKFPGGIPSQADQDTWRDEYDAMIATNVYSVKRKAEYDALNQFELISDDSANSSTTHADAIAAIKTKWPKDNSGPK